MALWFETKVKYDKLTDSGMEKKVTETYLVDALSFTEAESRIIECISPRVSGDFNVSAVKKTKIAEIFHKDAERFWNAKIAFVTLDQNTGIERKTLNELLVGARDFEEAKARIDEGMKGTLADWEINSLSESPVLEVFG